MRRLLATAALGLALAGVPAVPAFAGGGCHAPAPTEGTGVTVELGKNCMSPTVLTVAEGDTVTFVNRDPWVHNVFGVDWGHGDLGHLESFTQTFTEPGTYPYTCSLHPGMVGAVQVGDAVPVVAVSETSESPAPSSSDSAPVVAAAVFGALGLVIGLAVRRRRPA